MFAHVDRRRSRRTNSRKIAQVFLHDVLEIFPVVARLRLEFARFAGFNSKKSIDGWQQLLQTHTNDAIER
jgi:hypothetical protein